MTNPLDARGRPLDATERRQQEALMPALQAWTAYLTSTATAPTGSFDRAAERRSAVILKHVPSEHLLRPPVAVSPEWAHEWAIAHGHRGLPGTGSPLSFGMMVEALDFMRSSPARTFRPLLDSHDRRRRDGFFHLTAEMHHRLWEGTYTPVLTPRAGRPVADRRPEVRRSVRAIRCTDDSAIDIVRDWVRTSEPTALYEVAVRERRPMAVRGAGRPVTTHRRGAQVDRRHVLGSVEVLAWHASVHAGRKGWRVPSAGELTAALGAHAERAHGLLAPVTRFTTPDAGRVRRVQGWWRFALAPLGCGLLNPSDLQGEIDYWQAQQAAPVEQALVEPKRDYHGLALRSDIDPTQLDNPEYRDYAEVTDEEYERWKAGE